MKGVFKDLMGNALLIIFLQIISQHHPLRAQGLNI